MSQAGIISLSDIPIPPSVATSYVEDTGTAIPSGNILNVKGGSGITTTGSGNTITINATGASFTWQDQGTSATAVAENGYFVTAAITMTLPSSPTIGTTIAFIVDTTSALTIQASSGQMIRMDGIASIAGGTLVNTSIGDTMELVYRVTDATWISTSFIGGWIVT